MDPSPAELREWAARLRKLIDNRIGRHWYSSTPYRAVENLESLADELCEVSRVTFASELRVFASRVKTMHCKYVSRFNVTPSEIAEILEVLADMEERNDGGVE